jgi:anti-sigma regulatory factor (Ser/Thr protein kinase)
MDARRQVRSALERTRLRPQAVTEMGVTAGELLSNTHVHAYYSGVGPVFVEVFHVRWTVTVVVIDIGDAVVAPVVPNGLPYHTRRGGRGLYLASHLCDEVTLAVNRIGHGLTVRATKWFDDARFRLRLPDSIQML